MSTWSTYRAQIRRELEESTATVWHDDSLLWFANEAFRDIATQTKLMRDWQYTTAVAGQSSYDLPDRSLEVIQVYFGSDTDNTRNQLDRQDFTDWDTLDVTNGTPAVYAVDDDAIYLRPAPATGGDEISYLRYTYPEAMTADTDTVPFSDRASAAATYYIKSKANEQIKDFESADFFYQRYMSEIDRLIAQARKEKYGDRILAPAQAW